MKNGDYYGLCSGCILPIVDNEIGAASLIVTPLLLLLSALAE